MLSLLHIENIALIESVDLMFEPGLNVLTGETGAGKSIIIDSIGAVLGERTSRELIRTGAKSALVSAVFTQLTELPWLEAHGIPQGEELLLQREIHGDGRTVCRVSGRPVTVTQMKELGRQLLNIHGQHDGQHLLDEEKHLGYLDCFGAVQALCQTYRQAYDRWYELGRKCAQLTMDETERIRRLDTLEYQIGELQRADLKGGEEEELNGKRKLLRSAGKLTEALQEADYALSGGEEQSGACGLLADAEGAIQRVSDMSPQLAQGAERMGQLRDLAEEVAELIRELSRSMEFSPDELDEVEARLDILYRLKKKYGATVEEMLDYLAQCQEELHQLNQADHMREQLEQERKEQEQAAHQLALELSQERKGAANALQIRVQEELKQLDMPKVQFQVRFVQPEGEPVLGATGIDQVQFLMSANVGEALKPLQKVASGGELARIMLALKNVLAEKDQIGTLVFDEVDTGVSGRAAQRVGEKMAQVARLKQVLCVTHLPQIAAMAHTHFSVQKGERDGRTYTQLARLGPEERKEELARLMGGSETTPLILESAAQLLAQAEQWHRQRGG